MNQSSPGVPNNLPTVVASSATTVLSGPPDFPGTNVIGTGVISTNHVLSWVSSTGANNVYPAVLTEQAKIVPYSSSTPIVLPNQVGLFPNFKGEYPL